MLDDARPTAAASLLRVLVVWLFVLACLLLVATLLVWLVDDQSGARERGFGMLALSGFVLIVALVLRWFNQRPAPPVEELPPVSAWYRTRLGPPWLDWLSLVLPAVLVGLPVVLLRNRGVADAFVTVGALTFLIDLFVLPKLILLRRAAVGIELAPNGVVVRFRSGKTVSVARGDLRAVVLETKDLEVADGLSVSVRFLRLDLGGAKPISFPERMNRSLLQIARSVASHMGVPCDGGGQT